MARHRELWALLTLLCSACSLLNRPEQERAGPCDGGSCDACDRCDPAARCAANDGGVECVCPPDSIDLEGNGERCKPAQPRGDAGAAGAGASCERDPGAPQCACDPGYERIGASCRDIDECARGSHDCPDTARCVNRPGRFSCVCPAGHRLAADGLACDDVDECREFTAPCAEHAACENVPGGFECQCEPGYGGNAQVSCSDADECANGLLECSDRAFCQDQTGPDRCVCPPYYNDTAGDGSVCADDRVNWGLFKDFYGVSLAVDEVRPGGVAPPEERLVVAGTFLGTLALCDRVLQSSGLGDVFVAMLRVEDDHCLWARSFGSPEYDWVYDAEIDPRGGALLLVRSAAMYELDGTTIALQGSHRMALIRLDDSGALDWSLLVPDTSNVPSLARRLALDAAGDIYLRVAYDEATTLGPFSFDAPIGLQDNALVKISSAGTPLWAYLLAVEPTSVETEPFVGIWAMTVDPEGFAYVHGDTRGAVRFDAQGPRAGPLQYLVALDREGEPRWVRTAPSGSGLGELQDLVATGDGVVRALVYNRNDAGDYELMFKQFSDADGTELSKEVLGAGPVFNADKFEVGTSGQAVVAGSFEDNATIGDETLSVSGRSAFIASLDAEGEVAWVHSYDRSGSFEDVALAPSGAIYLTGGTFTPPVAFGDQLIAREGETFVIRLRP